jgi:DMSO/TMAO reductase YedYZ molybdopterin-dependent catalytic subunit
MRSRRYFLRQALTSAGAALLAGCDALSNSSWFPTVLETAEHLNRGAHHLLTSRRSMAQEFTEADLSPHFRSNGTANPEDADYQALAARLVQEPAELALAQLRAMPSRTQITRHDCVEGWSAIGKWTGVPLSHVLELVRLRPEARYIVFHCADPMWGTPEKYYESIDLEDALHPQTILAYELNDEELPIKNGAPLRVRIERQLGYKMAKYIMRIELVQSFTGIRGGMGGYWEDRGYEWFAGI